MMSRKKNIVFLFLFLLTGGAVGWSIYKNKDKKPYKDNKTPQYPDPPENNNVKVIEISLEQIADQLYQEMRSPNTDKCVIFHLLNHISEMDFAVVFRHFGKKPYSNIIKSDIKQPGVSHFEPTDLKGWLKSELSQADYQTLQQKFPNYL